MHFINRERDEALRLRMIDQEAFTLGELTSLVALATKENGYLYEDVILPFADRIDERRWLYWLVSKYRLFRLNQIKVEPEFIEAEGFSRAQIQRFRQWQAYPVTRSPDGKDLAVAIGRPDYIETVKREFTGRPILLATTPNELFGLHQEFGRFA